MENIKINVKYFRDDVMPLEAIDGKSDWIDLRANKIFKGNYNNTANVKELFKRKECDFIDGKLFYEATDIILIRFGIGIKLPEGKKARIYPRSSLYAMTGLLMTNSVGCIDGCYCGNDDEWMGMFWSTRSGMINKNERIAQFEVVDAPVYEINEVFQLDEISRNGFGSTGRM